MKFKTFAGQTSEEIDRQLNTFCTDKIEIVKTSHYMSVFAGAPENTGVIKNIQTAKITVMPIFGATVQYKLTNDGTGNTLQNNNSSNSN